MIPYAQETATREDVGQGYFLVGDEARIFDGALTNGLGALALGEVLSLYETTGKWRKRNDSDTTVGILCEAVATGYASTPSVPILLEGAVKLSKLTGAKVGWVAGMVVSGLILC